MKRNNFIIFAIAILIILVNGLIGHFFAPFGILFTPIVLTLTTWLVCFKTNNTNVILLSIFTFIFVALNDILIKLYSGGTHDNEGRGWIHLFLFIGLLPTFGILATTILRRKGEKLLYKIIALVLFVGLIAGHLELFSNLGLGLHY